MKDNDRHDKPDSAPGYPAPADDDLSDETDSMVYGGDIYPAVVTADVARKPKAPDPGRDDDPVADDVWPFIR
jgi:hypothetical protein